MSNTGPTGREISGDLMNAGDEIADLVRDGLREIEPRAEVRSGFALSMDADAWVKIIITLVAWEMFKGGASTYLNKWAELYAEKHFQNRTELLVAVRRAVGSGLGKLARLAQLISDVVEERHSNKLPVVIELPEHNLYFDVAIEDREEAVLAVSLIANYGTAIVRTANEIKGRVKPDAGITATVRDDGFTLRWRDASGEIQQQRYTFDGKPR